MIVSGLPGTLQRPQGRKGHKGRNLFLAQTVSFHQSVNPLWSLMVPDCVGPTQDPPAASKGRKGRQFFSAQTGPFDGIRPPQDPPAAHRHEINGIHGLTGKKCYDKALYSVDNRHDLTRMHVQNRNFPYNDFLRSNSCTTVLLIF